MVLALGDFNATLYTEDRPSARTTKDDTAHRVFVTQTELTHIPEPQPRARTWRRHNGVHGTSRIDILCYPAQPLARITTHNTAGDNTDHNLLKAHIPYMGMNLIPPPPMEPHGKEPIQGKVKLVTPISREDRDKLQSMATQSLPHRVHNLLAQTQAFLLYPTDAADELTRCRLGGRCMINYYTHTISRITINI